MLLLDSSHSSFETAALNLSYSSHNSLAPLKSNDLLLPEKDKHKLSQSSKPQFVHKRVVSNALDVVYHNHDYSDKSSKRTSQGSERSKIPMTPLMNQLHQQRNLYTPKNIYTPEHLVSPTNGLRRPVSDLPPVITMIDHGALTRSSSVISRQASLRNRYNLVKRNKMINKKSLDVNSASFDSESTVQGKYKKKKGTGLKNKLRFIFPVRRKQSLKQQSAYHIWKEYKSRTANFQTKEELEEFIRNTNSLRLAKELLPHNMKLYNYNTTGLFTRKPALNGLMRQFQFNENGPFTIIAPQAVKISAPFKDTFTKNGVNFQDKPREFSLSDAVYERYRTRVFAGKHQIPPKFSQLFPDKQDNSLITSSDVDHMNTKILFEVLLRRTLAAKIEYRLKQNGHYKKTLEKSDQSSQSSSSSDEDRGNVRHSHIPKLVHTDSEDSPDDESIDTDDLMQQNASLFSGLLPSPQISYKSDIFGSDFKLQSDAFQDSADDLSSRALRNENKLRKTASTNDLLNLVRHVTPPVPVPEPNSPFNTTSFNLRRTAREDSMNKRRNDELNVLEKALDRPQFNYELVPLKRSVETFSSSSESGMLSRTPTVELSKNNSLKSFKSISGKNSIKNSSVDPSKRNSNATSGSGSSAFDTTKRRSQSTTSTSILQELDDLSSQLTSFIERPEPKKEQPRFVHKNIVTNDDPLFRHRQESLSNQNIIESIKLAGSRENVTVAPSPTKTGSHARVVGQVPDVNSMKGSISVAGSETSTSYSQNQHYPQNFNHNYNLGSIAETRVLRRDDSMSTRTTNTFNRYEDRVSPTKQLQEHQH